MTETLRTPTAAVRPAAGTSAAGPTRVVPARRRRPGAARRIPLHVFLIAICAIWVVPLVGLIVYSLRTIADSAVSGWWHAFTAPLFTITNYTSAWTTGGIGQALGNSILIAVPTTVITITVCAIGAYTLARMKFRGRIVVLTIAVALLVVPPQLTLVPLLRVFNVLHLTGHIPGVWVYQVGFVVPFGIYLLFGFFRAFPDELIEAASLDGASVPRIFFSIVLPTATPILIALAIIQFMWSWNDLLIPLLFLGGGASVAPTTVQIAGLVQSTGGGLNLLTAAAIVSMIIPVIVTVVLQRYFVRGILGGAVKG
ncbi:carbohydrate ABC transporter permease [Frondihabitans cladoniiphilus]|uniref:Carbohydrate ABC transporter permease n=1 Tax=Frondihabitans cladoniiphilus TaxID=715785 RepID=A0ABP8VHK9_9MICO